ncbi:pyridoxamine 5'-phosphate oxidase [Nonlabens ulvanivorans]|uniref:Pyridoxamine 5'-phosphate oxidase n=1 Tax=Nonlabens ulvanivorans TaxID=906888 RepID=A0A081DA08_NONUL|nr:pyridoxamine 5'-phosphate oxidase family protein [Nonlabens ulvanivorans]GAK75754.1 pyridoxamine 5'-phosphate oxidase [Nonlabens ulvanivorans]
MLNNFFEELKAEFKSALSKRNHPFKYITLSTIDGDLKPQSRTVVLREIHDNLDCIIFTDSRTDKVKQLNDNAQACLLAYHPKKLLQLKLNGKLYPIEDPIETKRLFQKVGEKAIKDYTTIKAPGTSILNPDHVDYRERNENHFLALKFVPDQWEALKLKRPHHLRAIFDKDNDWKGQWLVP